MFLRPVFLSLLTFTSFAFGANITLSEEGAAAFALKHNPAMAAARLTLEEARGRLQQSGRLSNPELELEFNRNRRSRESAARATVLQRFPLTGRLRYEKAVSSAQLRAAEEEVRDAERKLAAEARGLAVRLLALKGQRDLRSTQLANITELSTFLRKSAEAGESSSTDALQVELESRQVEVERLQLSADEVVLSGEFRLLLGVASGEFPTVGGELQNPSVPLREANPSQRPDILAAQSRAEAGRFMVREQQARRLEDVGAGLSYSQERSSDAPNPIETDRIIGFRVTLPLPLWNHNSGRIHEAAAAAARAERELEAVRFTATEEVTSAKHAMKAYAKILAELDSRVLPQAKKLEEQLRASYSAGQTPLLEALRSRSRCLDLQRQRLDALRDFHLARIRYSSATHQQPIPTP
jgi:outer membrane protein, heavy metal efflux system